MSRSSRQSPSPDWQALLLEAIQQRDASSAISLAQRCVHRRGMATLHTLLDRADAEAGTQNEARTWLLLLLQQAEKRPQALASDRPLPQADRPLPPERPAQPTGEEGAPPPRPSTPRAAEVDRGPETLEPVTPSAPRSTSTPSTPTGASDLPLARASTSEALDQAFAPLEIAFPPLPLPERPEKRAPSPEPAPAPPPLGASSPLPEPAERPRPAGPRGSTRSTSDRPDPGLPESSARVATRGPHDPLQPLRGASGSPVSAELRSPSTPAVPSAPFDGADTSAEREASNRTSAGRPDLSAPPHSRLASSTESGHRLDDFSASVAAPVPSFHVDPLERGSSGDPRQRPQPLSPEERPEEPSAPTPRAKSLQAWRAWLPGPFRTRPRA